MSIETLSTHGVGPSVDPYTTVAEASARSSDGTGASSRASASSRDNASDAQIGPGAVIAVVGPSGVGKDALLNGARAVADVEAERIVFPEREITRAPHPSETNVPIGEDRFVEKVLGGAYAVWWRAHGLGYGVPIEMDADVRLQKSVVFNCSRAVIPALRERYARFGVILIDAPVPVRAERLAMRGREAAGDIARRLERAPKGFVRSDADAVVDNVKDVATGVSCLLAAVRALTASTARFS